MNVFVYVPKRSVGVLGGFVNDVGVSCVSEMGGIGYNRSMDFKSHV